jgi:hypothetical protein
MVRFRAILASVAAIATLAAVVATISVTPRAAAADSTPVEAESMTVTPGTNTGGTEGQVRWYAFSTKFDPTFPQNHADLGWALTNQWHADSNTGSPPSAGTWTSRTAIGPWSSTSSRRRVRT